MLSPRITGFVSWTVLLVSRGAAAFRSPAPLRLWSLVSFCLGSHCTTRGGFIYRGDSGRRPARCQLACDGVVGFSGAVGPVASLGPPVSPRVKIGPWGLMGTVLFGNSGPVVPSAPSPLGPLWLLRH